jgi:negative regulator of sigma-B (phosphoserine phosphatase)
VPDAVEDWVRWGVAARPLPGERESGDVSVVRPLDDGMLIAVIDGLGHGPEAAAAAQRAAAVLADHEAAEVSELFEACHAGLRRTRGAAISLARLRRGGGAVAWLGVGNVEARLLRADPEARPATESPLLLGGVVGHGSLPRLRATHTTLAEGDTLVFSTDGVSPGFLDLVTRALEPREIAARVLQVHGRDSDDALVLVARYTERTA